MGAWGFVLRHWRELPLQLVARSVSATPASGSAKRSARRQKDIVEGVFNCNKEIKKVKYIQL